VLACREVRNRIGDQISTTAAAPWLGCKHGIGFRGLDTCCTLALLRCCLSIRATKVHRASLLASFVSYKCLLTHCSCREERLRGKAACSAGSCRHQLLLLKCGSMDGACTIRVQSPRDRRASKDATEQPNANGAAAVGELCGMLTKLATVCEPARPPAEPQQQQVQVPKQLQPQSR
jgi:hypothetical protein